MKKRRVDSGQVDAIVMSFRKEILGHKSSVDMCYAICLPLVSFLQLNGISCKLTSGILKFDDLEYEHFWIIMSDGSIIDPTADQFNNFGEEIMPPVYIGEKPDRYLT